MAELKKWKLLGSKDAFKNRWWHVVQETVELPDGSVTEDFFVNHSPDGVVAFAMTEEGKIVLNRQYKHGAREIVTELAIGRHDNGERDPLEAAKRELLEETGYGGGEWEKIATFISNPTSSTARLHAYLARGVKKVAEPKKDPKEIIETFEATPAELVALVRSGEISTHAAVATIYEAFLKLGWLEFKHP